MATLGKQQCSWFTRFASSVAKFTGHPVTFVVAASAIILWAVLGPVFGFSDTWQLVVNTATTIITFLMVFLIQDSQNRDSAAIQIKLDELISTLKKANNALLDIEELDEADIRKLREEYELKAKEARRLKAAKIGAKNGSANAASTDRAAAN